MSGKKKIWVIVCGLLILASGAAAYLGAAAFNRSLNPALQLNLQQAPAPAALHNDSQALSPELSAEKAPAPQPVAGAAADKGPAGAIAPQTVGAPQALPKKTAQLTPLSQENQEPGQDITHCGFSGTMIVLFLGTDERMEVPYGADAIRFLKIDFTNLTVDCVDLSRDLWVKTPALADRNIKAERLGSIFDVVQTTTKGTIKEQYLKATTVLTQTIFDNFGVAPDHYMTVPQSSFSDLIDGLGGIEVEVPEDIDAYKHVILAGKRNLNGQQALAYIRQVQTFGTGDLERNARQLPYVKALLARMGEPANMVKLPGLINHLRENFVTDLSPAYFASLSCMLYQVPRENIRFHALNLDMTSPGPKDTLLPDYTKINPWVQGLLKK